MSETFLLIDGQIIALERILYAGPRDNGWVTLILDTTMTVQLDITMDELWAKIQEATR